MNTKEKLKQQTLTALVSLPMVIGIICYVLSYAILLLTSDILDRTHGASGGIAVFFIASFVLYMAGMMLCVITSAIKKSAVMIMLSTFLPLMLFTFTIRSCYCSRDSAGIDKLNKHEQGRPNREITF